MKVKNILALLIIPCYMIHSCSKSSLDKPPLGGLDGSALANKDGVEKLLIGAYSLLDGQGGNKSSFGSSGSNWIYGSICGSEAYKGTEPSDQTDITSIEIFMGTASNQYFASKWATLYDGVSRCNDVLRTIELVSDISEKDLDRITGETRFLRAYYHFEAKKIWNNIPFIDETITYNANNYKVSNTEDAWPRIEADLKYAVDKLPESQSEIARVNHFTALALLGKAYLFQRKFDSAKTALEEIIQSGRYGLVENYSDNFNAATQNNTEMILAAQNSVNDGSGGLNGNLGDILNYPIGVAGECCGFFAPSQWFVNHFKTDKVTGLPDLNNFNVIDVKNDKGLQSSDFFEPEKGTLDPRLDWSVGRRGIPYLDWGRHVGHDWVRDQTNGGPYSPKKNVYPKSQKGSLTDVSFWAPGSTANNINLIRYADVLLWAAEVEVEIGSLEKARDYVNQIRQRAMNQSGWVSDTTGDFAPFAANYKINLYTEPWYDQSMARKAVQYERVLELGMEGHRFFDIVRWRIADAEISQYLLKEKTLLTYLGDARFIAGKSEYFPIPQDEIDKSDHKLIQNPGY